MSDRTVYDSQHHGLRLPTGTETMHLREAARHRRITRILEDRFDIWGYSPVETPLVDFVEVYRPLLSEAGMRDTYRAVDRQGEIVSVRADTTLFLAKQLGLHLCAEELPVRVWYNDQIVRPEEEDEIAGNEYQQAGLELVGSDGLEADVEVLVILQDALQALDLHDAVIHLGSHEIITSLTEAHGIGPVDPASTGYGVAALVHPVRRRREVPEEYDLSRDEQELLQFIGDAPSFERALDRWVLPAATRAAAKDLLERTALLAAEPAVRIDTSELGAHDYYSGIAFGVYHHRSTAAITRGGRYDHLLGYFGFDAPSVGFSMHTRKFPASTQYREDSPVSRAAGERFIDRLAAVHAAHARGERMSL